MIAQSQSGTGKTAAFVLAMLSRVDPKKDYPQVSYHILDVEMGRCSMNTTSASHLENTVKPW
jgi:hypothetical protein